MWHSARLAAALLLASGAFVLQAQQSSGRVALHVVAVDSAGKPVPDLTAADFAVFDNGSPQDILSLRLNQSDQPHPVVILFDLLNSNLDSRGASWEAIKTSLAHLPSTDSLYLYLLVNDGSLYPVHDVKDAPGAAWINDVGPLLDAAMRKVTQVKPADFRASSPASVPAQFNASCKALDEMRARMSVLPGSKELLWVTYGFPSAINLADRGWWDGGATLRQLGARIVQSGITIYTVDPGISLNRGILNRDALDILTDATGGSTFSTVNLTKAITQVEADARINYTLEYQPRAGHWDGKYHKLRVTVARKGVRVETEHGYFAIQGS
jgi:VWFA-related protein